MYPALDRAALPRTSFHSLRHTHASLWIEDGGDLHGSGTFGAIARKACLLLAALSAALLVVPAAGAVVAGLPDARPLRISLSASQMQVQRGVLTLSGVGARAGWRESLRGRSGGASAAAVLSHWKALGFSRRPPRAVLVGRTAKVPQAWSLVVTRLLSRSGANARFRVRFVGARPPAGKLDRAGLVVSAPAPGDLAGSPSPNTLCTIGTVALLPIVPGGLPTGYLPADGRTMPITDDIRLFSLLGSTYGGNGTSTFGLPKLVSSVPGMEWGICPTSTVSVFPEPNGATSACRTGEITFFPGPMVAVFPTGPAWHPADGSSFAFDPQSQFAVIASASGTTFTAPNVPSPGANVKPILCTAGGEDEYWPRDTQFWYLGSLHLFAYAGPARPTTFPVGSASPSNPQITPADGRGLPIDQWQALWSLIGNRYGGNESAGNFNLPDLNASVPANALWAIVTNGDYPPAN